MSRPIDADELIEKIRKLPNAGIRWFVSAEAVFDIILNAPPIEPERKKGKWIEHGDGLILCECSECHEKYMLYEEHVLGRNFCPNCGVEMEKLRE